MTYKIPTIKDVQEYCQRNKISFSAFLESLGVNRSVGTYWKKGRSMPSYETIQKIVDKLNQENL